jgi:hypothetical protein
MAIMWPHGCCSCHKDQESTAVLVMKLMVEFARSQPDYNPSNLPQDINDLVKTGKDRTNFVAGGLHTSKRNQGGKHYLLARKRPSSLSWVSNILWYRLVFVLFIGYALFSIGYSTGVALYSINLIALLKRYVDAMIHGLNDWVPDLRDRVCEHYEGG